MVRSWSTCVQCGNRGFLQLHCHECLERKRQEILPGTKPGPKCKISWCPWEASLKGFCNFHYRSPDTGDLSELLTEDEVCQKIGATEHDFQLWSQAGLLKKFPIGPNKARYYWIEPWMVEYLEVTSCLH